MNKSAIVYTIPGCTRCDHTKNVLESLGYDIEIRDGHKLAAGEIHDHEAMAELMITDSYPVVVVGGRAVREGDELYNLINK